MPRDARTHERRCLIIEKRITISREYGSSTRRTNGFPEMGSVPTSFVFFQETDDPEGC